MLRSFRFRHRIESSPAVLLERLRDLDGLRRWAPGVDHSRLLVREGHVSVCELTFRDAERDLTLEVVYLDGGLRFAEVDRLAGHGIEGELRIEGTDGNDDNDGNDGKEDNEASAVDLRCRLPGRILWPPVRRRLREAMLLAAGALGQSSGAGDEARVEVVSETPELRLRIRGREYRLVPDARPHTGSTR